MPDTSEFSKVLSFVGVVVVSALNLLFWMEKLKIRRFRCLTHPNFTNFFHLWVFAAAALNLFYFHWKNWKYVDFDSWWIIFSIFLNENERYIATHDMSRIQHQGSLKTLFKDLYYSFLYSHWRQYSLFFFGKFQPRRIFFQKQKYL